MFENIKQVLNKPTSGIPEKTRALIETWAGLRRIFIPPSIVLNDVLQKHGRAAYDEACELGFAVLHKRFHVVDLVPLAITFDPATGMFTVNESACGHDTIQVMGNSITHPIPKGENPKEG